MRVIFMGTPDFAVGTLEEIIKAGHEVVLVVSQPDKAVGRSKALRYTRSRHVRSSKALKYISRRKSKTASVSSVCGHIIRIS